MRVYEGSEALRDAGRGCVLTVGNFDGLHLGHRALLDAVLARARQHGGASALYTFHPHPRRVLAPDSGPPQLMLWEQLEHELELLGLDILIRERFTREFAAQPPEAFVRDVLAGRIGPSAIVVGRDFHFGRQRSGSGDLLGRLGPELGFEVDIIAQVMQDGRDVSSTRIREALAAGDVAGAGEALGRPYEVWGEVIAGDRRGRELGFPTANLDPASELMPAHGVYATRVRLFKGDRPRPGALLGVTNVGLRPTFAPGRALAETHLIDWSGDLYGQRLALAFCERIRPEQRFDGPEALREQIARDVAEARRIHAALAE